MLRDSTAGYQLQELTALSPPLHRGTAGMLCVEFALGGLGFRRGVCAWVSTLGWHGSLPCHLIVSTV